MTHKIAQYDILGELGRGGMGVVYDALDPRLDRHVAIKVIELPNDPNMTQETRLELVERFKREAKASAKLNHPNIVSIFDFGIYEGRYYMVMEFLQGRNLAELLQIHSPLSIPVALKAMIQTCDALDFAHHQGVIHRDIKPANIVVLDNGTTKLADFGIARLEASNSELTKAGSILGSLLYISPEQLMNPKDVDKRADIYSLGVTAYEILTGRLPYNGSNIGEIVMKIMQSEPPLLSELNRNIPEGLDAIIFKAMAKTADLRYDTAKDLAKDLQSILNAFDGESAHTQHNVIDLSQTSVTGASVSTNNREVHTQYGDDQQANLRSNTVSTGSPLTLAGTQGGKASSKGKNYNLLQGVDDATPYAVIHRVLRDWNVENMSTNTMLEAIYKYEGKSQGLIINNSVILLIYKGLIVGAVSKNSELTGTEAYCMMAAWQKFEMTQCIPLEKDEPWLVLLAILTGAHTLLEEHPMSSPGDMGRIIETHKSRNYSGMIKVQERQHIRWSALLDGEQVFSVSMPHPTGSHDDQFADVKIYAPRMNLIGPSLRKLLVESQLQVVTKSTNRPNLSQYAGSNAKGLTSELLEEALRNTDLRPVMSQDPTYTIGNREIKYSDILKETNHYRIVNWLMYELMYSISRSPDFVHLKNRFKWVWQIKSLKFIQPVKMGSFSATFDVLAYNSQEQLIGLFRINNQVEAEAVKNLLADLKRIQEERPQDNLCAGFLVSLSAPQSDAITLFNQLTSKPGNFPFLNFADKAKGFVKTGWNKGFYVGIASTEAMGIVLQAPELSLEAAR